MFNPKIEVHNISNWIKSYCTTGAVINLKNDRNSVLTTKLLINALGKENVNVIHLEDYSIFYPDKVRLIDFCKLEDIDLQIFKLHEPSNKITKDISTTYKLKEFYSSSDSVLPKTATQDFENRLEMATSYLIAQTLGYLVCGYCSQSQRYVGNYSMWGENSCDFNPVGNLTNGELKSLYTLLNLPDYIRDNSVIEERDMGLLYIDIDSYIRNKDSGCENTNKNIKLLSERNRYKLLPPVSYIPKK